MLEGLDALELGRLRISVGYGTHKKGRPLTPIEVAQLVERARCHGASLAECAREIRIDESGLGRFLRLLKLPDDLRHLVDWGGGPDILGFSVSTELLRIGSVDDMRAVAAAVLEHRLNAKETRQVAQLLGRSQRLADDALREVLNMRPVIERRYVFIGTIVDAALVDALSELTQREKNAALSAAITALRLTGASGRLGTTRFTLVGDERFGARLSEIDQDGLDTRISSAICKEVDRGQAGG